jgi:site-specific DNA-cytosine methylase
MHRGAVVGIYGGAAPADATDGAESNGDEGVSGEGGDGEDGGGEECGDATNGKMAGGAGGQNEGAEPAVEGARGEGARFYTAREATRLMGFPESFRIPGHPTPEHGGPAYEAHERYFRQIGNAVCPPVVEAVARQMLRALNVQFQVHEEEETL